MRYRGFGRSTIGWSLVALGALVLSAVALAQSLTIYSHEDESGTVHLTNIPRGGPYRRIELPSARPPAPTRGAIRDMVREVARRYNVDIALAEAVAEVESSFRPEVVSSAGAMGVMQLMPATADRFRVRDPYDPRENIRGGIEYLSWLIREFDGDLPRVLAGYHAGEQRVHSCGGIPPIPATEAYVERTLKVMERILRQQGRTAQVRQYVDEQGVLHLTNTR